MTSRIISTLLIIFIGYMLYKMFNFHWAAILIAVSTGICSIAAILPPKLQAKSSYIVRAFAALILIFGLLLLCRRMNFIYVNGGMEGPNGHGSPLAFLIGFVFEQILFTIPSLFILWAYSNKRVKGWQSA